ncbi:sugar ABC transporter ATP-binding protein [Amycolatopsis nigrescens]|uniref:sugar ABC transporter ATP-binding protein n=1 Tax=Amycolatopsis nigrescens TaxID=381445 RepID=UPI00037EB983|nr:sugar ABC transporter ATP-binding protein [Amycolatopsis nigrescens]
MNVLDVQGAGKTYGGVVALDDASLSVRAGSVHALLGENGAGKSTLIKIVSGAVRPDRGSVSLQGRAQTFASTADAAAHGVAVVSQELNLFPDLDVLANLYPMREPKRGPFLSRTTMAARAAPVLAQLGLDVDVRQPLSELSLAQRQLVEIAKALLTEPKVLILDEPTSALEAASTERLVGILRTLRQREVAVVFVSHLLEEVMALCDEITVLREGRTALAGAARDEVDMTSVVTAMLGHRREIRPKSAPPADPGAKSRLFARSAASESALEFAEVTVPGRLSGASFVAEQGEVLGLAGLVGAGHSAVLEVVAGLRQATAGKVRLLGDAHAPRNLRAAINAGVALVSGDRQRLGLMSDKPLWENVAQVSSVALGRDGALVHAAALRRRAADMAERLRIRASHVDVPCGLLSGGNQQKVVLAKWLQARPRVMLLDDPTRGVGISGKDEIHALLRTVAAEGTIVLLCSTDLDELAMVCDRVLVFHRQTLCGTLHGTTPHTILHAMNTGALPER